MLPVVVVVVAAAVWGLFWIPLRAFEANGLEAGWATLAQFVTPALLLAPVAIWRLANGRPTGTRHAATGIILGAAFVLFYESLLLTEVVHALLLFYLTPLWGTLLEMAFLGQRLVKARALALTMGLAGLLIVLASKTGIPVPQNAGDVMALASGVLFAIGTLRVRQTAELSTFEHMFSFFLYGSIFAIAMALLPLEAVGSPPSWEVLEPLLPWVLAMAAGLIVPMMWGLLWGSKHVNPGRLGILLQMEAVVGIGSAAILANEPFGIAEVAGTLLIVGAAFVDIFGGKSPQHIEAESGVD
jgi:drug/metabolite transporter (DMT)-like permease